MTTAADNSTMKHPDSADKTRRRRPQFALSTFLLLIAALASWAAYWQTLQRTESLRRQLPGLRRLARELRVSEPRQYAAVERLPTWYDEHIWDLYLPPNQTYELCLALEGIEAAHVSTTMTTQPDRTVTLLPGRHTVELQDEATAEKWSFLVLLDGEMVIEATRPADWNPSRSSTGGSVLRTHIQQSTDEPLELFRRRFHVPQGKSSSTTPDGPANGVHLWIRAVNRS